MDMDGVESSPAGERDVKGRQEKLAVYEVLGPGGWVMHRRGTWFAAVLILLLAWAAYAGKADGGAGSSLSGNGRIDQASAERSCRRSSAATSSGPAGGTAVLSFVQGGVRATLAGPCKVKVAANGVHMLSGTAARVSRPEVQQGQPVAVDINVNKMGGQAQRVADQPPEITLVTNAASMEPPARRLASATGRGAAKHHNSHQQPRRYDRKWPVAAGADGFTVPADQALTPGKDYMVYALFVDDNGHHQAEPMRLKVMAPQAAAGLKARAEAAHAEAAAHPDDTTPLVQLVNLYTDNGLYSLALQDYAPL